MANSLKHQGVGQKMTTGLLTTYVVDMYYVHTEDEDVIRKSPGLIV